MGEIRACESFLHVCRLNPFPTIALGVVTPRRPPIDGESDRRVSVSLSSRADWTRQYILDGELAAAQLPERVRKPGKAIDKPGHW
jgi:hypothetical protein